jgi:hypothetical protein
MEGGEAFLWGCFGGILAELLGWFRLRHELGTKFPDHATSIAYWLVTLLMVLAGGGLALAYIKSNVGLNAVLALNVGASAPLILGTLAAQAPRLTTSN